MPQTYKRTPVRKYDFNWNRTSVWVFYCKFSACFRNIFSWEHLWRADFFRISVPCNTYERLPRWKKHRTRVHTFCKNYSLKQHWTKIFRSTYPGVFFRKGVLKICSKFTGEHPCRSVISLNRISARAFSEHLFLRTPLEGCFWILHFAMYILKYTES